MAKYPEKITTDHYKVFAALDGDAYVIHFPYSKEAVAIAKEGFTAPKWDAEKKVWRVNKRWHKKIPETLIAISELLIASNEARNAAELEKRNAEVRAGLEGHWCMESMKPYSGGIQLSFTRHEITIKTSYHEEITTLFKSAGGKWDADHRNWVLPISAGVMIYENRDRIRDLHNEAVSAKNQTREQKRKEIAARRKLVLCASAPKAGDVVNLGGKWVRIESLGKRFLADDDTSSLGGPIGAEGEYVCYAYYTEATPEEISSAESSENARIAKAKEEANRREVIKEAVTAIKSYDDIPSGWHEPEGEMHGRGPTIYGTGDWFIIGPEWIWWVENNGMDGDDWSRNNVRTGGAGAIGYRAPFSEDIAEKIRQGTSK